MLFPLQVDLQLLHQGWLHWGGGLSLGRDPEVVSGLEMGSLQPHFYLPLGQEELVGHLGVFDGVWLEALGRNCSL